MTTNHYEVLGVSRSASESVIRAVHRALMKESHPDAGGDPARARALNEARDVLLDTDRRAAHDRDLDARVAETIPPPGSSPGESKDVKDFEDGWGTETSWDAGPDPQPNTGGPMPPPYPGPPGPGPYASGQRPPYASSWMQPGHSNPGYGSGPLGTRPAPGPALSARQVWASATVVERIVSWLWITLSLVGPLLVVIDGVRGSGTGFLQNLILYAVSLLVSLHVGWTRVTEPRLPKRYVVWVALSIVLVVTAASSSFVSMLFFGVWTVTFVMAVELRRRRLWQQS